MTAELINTYLYDAEGRICAVYSSTDYIYVCYRLTGYVYDAAGNRVAKGSISTWSCDMTTNGFTPEEGYVVGPAGEQLSEMKWVNNGWSRWEHTNVYAGGKLIGTYDGNASAPTLHFHIDDPLGTRRAQVAGSGTNAGTLEAVYQSLPFGDGLVQNAVTTTDDPTENHFTGKERDAESGNDYFLARYYSSATGRFLSPDWSAKVEPVPYSKLDNPQSLNLYGYMRNNPLGGVDQDGHCPSWMQGVCDAAKTYVQTVKKDVSDVAKSSTVNVEWGVGFKFEKTGKETGANAHAGGSFHAELEKSKDGFKTTIKAEVDAGLKIGGVEKGREAGFAVDDKDHPKPHGYIDHETSISAGKAEVKGEPDQISIGGAGYDVVGGGVHVSASRDAVDKLVDDVLGDQGPLK